MRYLKQANVLIVLIENLRKERKKERKTNVVYNNY